MRIRLGYFEALLLIVASQSAEGQLALSVTQEAKLLPATATPNAGFGGAVALSGDTALISRSIQGPVAVRVRSGTTWAAQAELIGLDTTSTDDFGRAIALSGDTAVVGASEANAAYVFVRTGTAWTQQAKLVGTDSVASDLFGSCVAISGNTVVVGAPGVGLPGVPDAGAAYVFLRVGTAWSQHAKLTASEAATNDGLGTSVAISEDTVVVSAAYHDGPASNSGAAFVFVRHGTSWTEQAELSASDATADVFLGRSVGISHDTILVGAQGDSAGAPMAGSAYVFTRAGTTWTQESKITNPDPAFQDAFGYTVAINNDTAVIGAVQDSGGGITFAGAAYVFLRSGTTWSEQAKLTADHDVAGGAFGASAAIDGDTTVVGAIGDDQSGAFAGAAYVYRLESSGAWTDLGLGMAGSGGVPTLTGLGTLQANSPLTLSLQKAKPFSLAPIFVGISAGYHFFKSGVLVPNPDFIFMLTTDFFGKSSFGGLWPTGIPSDFTTYFQWWIQDPAGPKGFAASNAVAGTTP